MKKSIKKFLIISQVLGWSALVASACTDDQVKTNVQNSVENKSTKDSGANKQNDDYPKNTENQVVEATKVGKPLTYKLSEGHPPADGHKPSHENTMNTKGDRQESKVNKTEGNSVTSSGGGEADSAPNPTTPKQSGPQANQQPSQQSGQADGTAGSGMDGAHPENAKDGGGGGNSVASSSSSEVSRPASGGGNSEGQSGGSHVTPSGEMDNTSSSPETAKKAS